MQFNGSENENKERLNTLTSATALRQQGLLTTAKAAKKSFAKCICVLSNFIATFRSLNLSRLKDFF